MIGIYRSDILGDPLLKANMRKVLNVATIEMLRAQVHVQMSTNNLL